MIQWSQPAHTYDIQGVDRPVSYTVEAGSPEQRIEPVTLARAKASQRVTTTAEDDLFLSWIATARIWFEEVTGRQLIDAVREYAIDAFPLGRTIELPRPPLVSVDSIVYDDPDGNEQTMDPSLYRVLPSGVDMASPISRLVDPFCPRGFVQVKYGAVWPSTAYQAQAVRIRFVCGYGEAPETMPAIVTDTLCWLVGHLHRNRQEVIEATRLALQELPQGAKASMQMFKDSAVKQSVLRGLSCR